MVDTFLRDADVTRVTGILRSTRYEMIERGEFPKSIKLSERIVAWSARRLRSGSASASPNVTEAQMRAPPDNRNAALARGVGSGLVICKKHLSLNRSRGEVQALLFTARPRGTRWSVAAISDAGDSIKLGIFGHRDDALDAAAVMARACGGRWLP